MAQEWREHLETLNDETAPFEERKAAQESLLNMYDPAVLPEIFRILADPVGMWTASNPLPRPVPIPEWPAWQQIPQARLTVFAHFARRAQPEEERKRIFVQLFDEVESDFQFRELISRAIHNRSPQLEQKLWSIFADRENPPSVRSSVVGTLTSVADSRYGHQIIEYAWQERGSEVATNLGAWVTHHPLQNLLMLDWYERERNPETRRSGMPMSDMLDRVDQSFGNITGRYERSLEVRRQRLDTIVRQRSALQDEARLTGDDARLRAFEAELAAKQQAELEERIEKIDAWIAANRDRLEAEAADFARQREEQRQREQSPPREQPPPPDRD